MDTLQGDLHGVVPNHLLDGGRPWRRDMDVGVYAYVDVGVYVHVDVGVYVYVDVGVYVYVYVPCIHIFTYVPMHMCI